MYLEAGELFKIYHSDRTNFSQSFAHPMDAALRIHPRRAASQSPEELEIIFSRPDLSGVSATLCSHDRHIAL
jgi:hypothetical protein